MRLNEEIVRIMELMDGMEDYSEYFPIMDEMFKFISDERSDRIEVLIPDYEGDWNLNNWNRGKTMGIMSYFIEQSKNPKLVEFVSNGNVPYDLSYQWIKSRR